MIARAVIVCVPFVEMTNSSQRPDKTEQLNSTGDLHDESIEGTSGSNMTDDTTNRAVNFTFMNPITSYLNAVKNQLHDMGDEQRMERLQSCRTIEEVHKDCRRFNKLVKQKQQSSTTTEDDSTLKRTVQLEDVPPGIRILKYYDWRNIHDYDHSCIREKHATWACRAGALQCGAELVQLRHCFNVAVVPPEGVTDPNNKNYGAVLSISNTAYEPSKHKHTVNLDTIPCREFQEKLGQCIAKNATALAEREMRRSEKKTTSS